jgi:hypothetical protein
MAFRDILMPISLFFEHRPALKPHAVVLAEYA